MGSESILSNESLEKETLLNKAQGVFTPRNVDDPRKESFWDMIYINLFPQLTVFSFSFIFSCVLLLIFIIQLIACGVNMMG